MTKLPRRKFLQLGGVGAALGAGFPTLGLGAMRLTPADTPGEDRVVRLGGDGVGLSPSQYARLLNRLLDEKGITPDSYSLGGVVEELEQDFARVLGKERAIFMPTGTLANHLAVRALAGGASRAIVQSESHLYQDEGDCAQTLSSITLMPLAPGRATFTADEVQHVLDETKGGRVMGRVSVISIETPVRRKQGATFDSTELAKVVALARREGVRLHLDGARLFLQAGYTGTTVAEYAQPFDTVYVSLYKYFNAAGGAILAGPRELIGGMYHARRMFGGGLVHAWPFAVVALHYLPGFVERYRQAVRISEDWIRRMRQQDGFSVETIPSGTNLFRLRVAPTVPPTFQKALAAKGIMLSGPQPDGAFLIGVNETLNRTTASDLADAFVAARSS